MLSDTLFIVNPISGGRTKRFLISRLKGTGARIVFTERAGQAAEIAACAEEGTIVAVGGDGTVNEVARGILGKDKTMGIIPCGSGDGLARNLGISHLPDIALAVIKNGHTRMLDCAQIDGKPFFSVCGVGLDADVSEKFAKSGKRGLETYIKEAIKVWKDFEPQDYSLTIDGEEINRKAVLVTVGNSNQWGNNARITPLAKCDDGQLDITIVKDFDSAEIPVLAFLLMTGQMDKSRRAECLRGRDIVIRRQTSGPAHCDGDSITAGREIHISLTPSKIKVLAP